MSYLSSMHLRTMSAGRRLDANLYLKKLAPYGQPQAWKALFPCYYVEKEPIYIAMLSGTVMDNRVTTIIVSFLKTKRCLPKA